MTTFASAAIITLIVLGIIFKLLIEISNLSDEVHYLKSENEELNEEVKEGFLKRWGMR